MGADPEFGTGDSSPHGGTGSTVASETDPHLILYSDLHDEIHLRISINGRNLLTGLSLIGLIIAYALLSGEFIFLASIPAVIAVLIVQTVFQLNSIIVAAHQLSRIERSYVDDYPQFDWEDRFGLVGTEHDLTMWGINWRNVPQAIIFGLALCGYVGSSYVGYILWPPEGVDILIIGLTRNGLFVIYVLLTVLVGLAGISYALHLRELGSSGR